VIFSRRRRAALRSAASAETITTGSADRGDAVPSTERRSFSASEWAILEAITGGDWPDADAVRKQLATARFAGNSHGDRCFDIEVALDAPLLFLASGEIAETCRLVESQREGSLGLVSLWVKDHRVCEFDFSEFGLPETSFPTPAQLRPWTP
jgi:hypothetical protein